MTKIALTTKYSAYNFGAMLQTYALQRTLNTLGAECLVVDADRQKRPTEALGRSPRALINGLFYRLHKNQLDAGYEKFETFMLGMPLTSHYETYGQLQANPPVADVYLTGSDQVWNPMKVSDNYFLRFAPNEAVRAAYAASLGVSDLPQGCQSVYREYLQDFDYISVREQDAKKTLDTCLGTDAKVHIDPVFLLEKDTWQEVAVAPDMKKPYILCYILYRPAWLNRWLRMLHKKTGMAIVVVSSDPFRNVYHTEQVRDAGPCEMLGLIQNAAFVITSSFHGTALSIVNEKPFYAVVNPAAPSRIQNLLTLFGLEERAIGDASVDTLLPLDYAEIKPRVEGQRKQALEYLQFLASCPPKHPQTLSVATLPQETTVQAVGSHCTGCKACGDVCPVKAITFAEDTEGFRYPVVDETLCIHCGKCLKFCHTQKKNRTNTKESATAYYGWHKDHEIREASSSGGIFTALADKVIAQGGLVIGAYFDPATKQVRHGNSDEIPIARFRGSKYAESDLADTYTWISNALAHNRWVLFCGTPCQCAGLRQRFGTPDTLFLVDFFCHGVPSAKVFSDYLIHLEQKQKDTLTDYMFRTKTFGWKQYGIKKQFSRQTQHTVGRCEFFYRSAMVDNLFLRQCCYTCDKAMYHDADLTIGDCWGNANLKNAPDGVSVVVVNTPKGAAMKEQLENSVSLVPMEMHLLDYAFQVKTGDKQLPRRAQAFAQLQEMGIAEFAKKYYRNKLFFSRVMFALKKGKLKKAHLAKREQK